MGPTTRDEDELPDNPKAKDEGRGGSGGVGGVGGVGGPGPGGGTGGPGGVGGPGGTGGEGAPAGPHPSKSRILGIAVLIMSLVSAVYIWRTTSCQAEFNNDFAIVLENRSQYAEQDRQLLIVMLVGALSGKTPEIRRMAVQDFITAAAKNDQLRKQNPLPRLSDRNCSSFG